MKIVATRCQILRLKCTKFNFGWASAPTLLGSLQRSPDPPARFKGPTFKGEGKGGRGGVPSTFFLCICAHTAYCAYSSHNTVIRSNLSRRVKLKWVGECHLPTLGDASCSVSYVKVTSDFNRIVFMLLAELSSYGRYTHRTVSHACNVNHGRIVLNPLPR